MDKLLNELQAQLKANYIEIAGQEGSRTLNIHNDSLILSIIESSLSWNKKKIETLFETSSKIYSIFPEEAFNSCVGEGYISKCLKPSLNDNYFINLNGLNYLESKKTKDIISSLLIVLQNSFYQDTDWKIKDEEKLILSILILFNAINPENSFQITTINEDKIWEFMKWELAPVLVKIGICNSFEAKILAKSTKYASAKNFISGQPDKISRSRIFVPSNGKYFLNLTSTAEKQFLVILLFSNISFQIRLDFIKEMELLGQYLYHHSLSDKQFVFDDELQKLILN